ncbi:alginate O-acetyltransferase AlgF [Agrobacterium rosae]|uniref:alginate O-acetyltransferase AlgF n=1 Tax=Agrobacterium rosae TaxID=1972867 RepID=UPI003A80796F
MNHKTTFSIAVLVAGFAVTHGFAQDAGLYGKAADPKASFVRVVSLDQQSATIGGKPVPPTQGVSPYVNVNAGSVEISSGGQSTVMTVEPGKYYTMTMGLKGERVFSDVVKNDPAKAQLYLYNLSDLVSVDLFVPAAKAVALKGVAAGESRDVALKAPLSLAFEIQKDGSAVATTETIDLKRKTAYSIVITGANGRYSAVALENNLLQR